VCITVLNSYSGWALVAEGFLLDSPLITVIGSLIGFSGAILTKIMCDAMNRDIMNVIFGGMNVAAPKAGSTEVKEHTETNVDGAAAFLAESNSVMIVPGYGMAVARCQNSVASIAKTLRDKGKTVRFGIHPVAGRMPGQMNVLLAEAGVPYDWVQEMDEVNPDMDSVDTCLIVGANDTTNSGAQEGGSDHPLAGMPVIEVWKAKKVIFMKRTMGAGYADVENPVFFKENTDMLLGNATDTAEQIAAKVKELVG
jgi:NAD(P) transhydrogenase